MSVPGIRNKKCALCKKLCESRTNACLMGDGPEDADIVLVGEAPGKDEDKFELPFVGEVGEFLRSDILPETGVDDTELYITNAARCRPPKNRTPSAIELQNCRTYLEQEIRAVKPKVIVAMGNAPLASLLGMIYKPTIDAQGEKTSEGKVSGITRWRGREVWSREFGCWIMPTYHPSYVMRGYNKDDSSFAFDQMVEDIAKASQLVGRKPKNTRIERVWIQDRESAEAVLDEMWDAGTFAYDIETGGTGIATNKKIIGCSFSCSETKGYYMTMDVIKQVMQKYMRLLSSTKHTKLMHNGAYELKVHRFNNMRIWDKYYDTLIASHMLDENFGKSLKDLSWIHTSFGGYDISLDRYRSKHRIREDYSKIPDKILAPYGAYDAVATYTLWRKTRDRMKEENVAPLFDKIIMPVRRVMSEAEYNGIRVDLEYANTLRETCTEAMGLLEKRVYEIAGREFNINSTKQLADVLYKDMKLEPLKKSRKTGNPSVDMESVNYIAEQGGSDIAKALSDRSYMKTMLMTHISQAVRSCWADGRVHTSYHMGRAVTGRTSCSDPSIHNVPRDRLIRTMYVASPGCVLVEADLKSAELAYLAAESGEQAFLRSFAKGLDLHSETAKVIYGVKEPTEEQRAFAKSTNFALVYGMTEHGLSKRLGITLEEAEDFIVNYFDQFPRIAAYMDRQRQHAVDYGYVKSLFNRRRRLPDAMSDIDVVQSRALRQAQNSPIQSDASDYTYLCLVRLHRCLIRDGLQAKIVHTVHDCGLLDTPEWEIDNVKPVIVEAFETPIKLLPVKMKVEMEIGKAWGEHTKTSRVHDILESVGLAEKVA